MEFNKKELVNEMGFCPKCDENTLNYGEIQFADDLAYFNWTCEECGLEGKEWYRLEFLGHSFYDENGKLVNLGDEEN